MFELISIIVPVFNEADSIVLLYREIAEALVSHHIAFELILVDDGSTDGSAQILTALAASEPAVRAVFLDRNHGQSSALRAGIDYCAANVIVIMDGDLQNDPRDIPVLLQQLRNGCHFVQGYRKSRKDNWLFRRFPSQIANRWISWYTGFEIRDIGCGLKAMYRDTATKLDLRGNRHRYMAVIAHFQGACCFEVAVNHRRRNSGKSKYGIRRIPQVVLDVIRIRRECGHSVDETTEYTRLESPYRIKQLVGFSENNSVAIAKT